MEYDSLNHAPKLQPNSTHSEQAGKVVTESSHTFVELPIRMPLLEQLVCWDLGTHLTPDEVMG